MMKGTGWFDGVCQDVRYAVRGFSRARAFTIAAIATLALGIGSTTAVFSVVDRILFRSLPYPAEDRIVSVGFMTPLDSSEFFTGDDYRKFRAEQMPFESMTGFAAVSGSSMTSGVNPAGNCDIASETSIRVNCAYLDSTFLSTFGIHPLFGRDFTDNDLKSEYPNVALLSYSLWQTHFSGATDIVGKNVSLDGHPVTIIGVLPSTFEMPTLTAADLVAPLTSRGAFVRAFAKLKPGYNIAQARQALAPVAADTLKSSLLHGMEEDKVRIEIRSLRDRQVEDVRAASYILLAAVFLVLVIACTNVANLLLARSTARRREFAVRRALGAGSTRLARQTMTESLLIGIAGGTTGLAFAYSALHAFVAIAPQGIPRLNQANLDARVILFALVASLATGIVFGMAPSLHRPAEDALRTQTSPISRSGFRQFLIVGQIGLSVVLLSGGVLLMRTLWNLERVPLGMKPERVTVISIRLPKDRYAREEQQITFFEELERRLQESASIGKYALTDAIPPGAVGAMAFPIIHVEGRPDVDPGVGGVVAFRHITPDYFSVLGVPLLHGRLFSEVDRKAGARTVILSDELARRLFPVREPVGSHVRFENDKDWMTVVGVVGNVKNNPSMTGTDDPELYFPRLHGSTSYIQGPSLLFATILLRSQADLRSTADSVRKLVADLDPMLPITIETMPQRLAKLTDRPRFTAALLSAFAISAVLLAAVGLSGILSFLVIQRTQEIGVRMALGASAQTVVRLIIGYALRWTFLGITVGLVLSLLARRALRTLLFQVPERDPWTLAGTSAVLLLVALLAAWIPSRRASQVDPLVALRHD